MDHKSLARKVYSEKLSDFVITDNAKNEIAKRIVHLLSIYQPKVIFGFAAIKKEVDLQFLYDELEQQGFVLAFPRYDFVTEDYNMVIVKPWREQMVCARYNIAEPLMSLPKFDWTKDGELAVWLVPGVAFSPAGVRLGRGKGYYDRLMENKKGLKIGIAWSCQIAPFLEKESHDILMDEIITEKQEIHCR